MEGRIDGDRSAALIVDEVDRRGRGIDAAVDHNVIIFVGAALDGDRSVAIVEDEIAAARDGADGGGYVDGAAADKSDDLIVAYAGGDVRGARCGSEIDDVIAVAGLDG